MPEPQCVADAIVSICSWCGLPLPADRANVERDHIIPVYWGGPDAVWNLQDLHKACNRAKGNKLTVAARELAQEHGIALTPRKERTARLEVAPEISRWLAEWGEAIDQLPGRIAEDPWLIQSQEVMLSVLRRGANRGMYLAWRDGQASLGDLARLLGTSRAAARKRVRLGLADEAFDIEAAGTDQAG